jgi:hypothetical protein
VVCPIDSWSSGGCIGGVSHWQAGATDGFIYWHTLAVIRIECTGAVRPATYKAAPTLTSIIMSTTKRFLKIF